MNVCDKKWLRERRAFIAKLEGGKENRGRYTPHEFKQLFKKVRLP